MASANHHPSRLSPATLEWIERSIGRGARVVGCRRLTGGITSIVQRLLVEHRGRRAPYVLRRCPSDAEHPEWNIASVGAETTVLAALEQRAIPAPRVIGATSDTDQGGPAVLMTCLPGRIQLMPRDRERWLRQMASTLAHIHVLDIPAPPFESWLRRDQLSPPPDAPRPNIWREAIAVLADEPPLTQGSFIHRDYQHFNLLWSRERLTGVVDWGGACHGPPDVDVGHCRLNLTLLFSAEVADRFLALYEAEAGRRVDPWWDLHELLSFGPDWKHFLPMQIDGRAPLDVDGMPQRMEDVIERTLRR